MFFLICGGGSECVISVPLCDHFIVGTCLSIGDLCCLDGLEARPFERDLDLAASVLELQAGSFDLLGPLRSGFEMLLSFMFEAFLFALETRGSV